MRATAINDPSAADFTIAVIPDAQNYLDYTRQTAEGFPFDASELLCDQMRYIAGRAASAGGDIAFVTAVGDTWQHQTLHMDAAHLDRGFGRIPNPILDRHFAPSDKVLTVEMPGARRAFELIAGKVPFSVVPGNHDHDAMWSAPGFPPDEVYNPHNPTSLGMLHAGGLDNWTQVFGAASPFFAGQPWYVASCNGGASSAQVFEAAGRRYLHIGLEFAPKDATLAWAMDVMADHRGLPTIVTVHDFINAQGERAPNPCIDMQAVDPDCNNPQDIWEKFIDRNDEIFLVLSGHQPGQAYRVDPNRSGGRVHQLLANYQHRGQTQIAAGSQAAHPAIGDGWFRLMSFDLAGARPKIRVRTYSPHYEAYASDHPSYADWYKRHEQPHLSDDDFLAMDEFDIPMDDFTDRFR